MTPRRLDPVSVGARLRLMQEALEDLEALGPVDRARLEQDRLTRRALERILTHLVDTAAAVNAHVVGAVLGHAPRDLAQSFDEAVRAGALPEVLGTRLRGSAGMRNVIVHAYEELDLDLVVSVIPRAQADFARYVEEMARFVADR